jgi:hypothetical protein
MSGRFKISYMKRKYAEKPPMIVISGSCLNFDYERPRIMEFIGELEWGVHTKSDCEVSSTGNALGWDFFQIYFDQTFVEKLIEVYPDIQKEEGHMLEQEFVSWLSRQLKKRNLEYYLKLVDIPYQNTGGFRLNPGYYRDEKDLEDLR